MTTLTVIACGDMTTVLARRGRTVMATETGTGNRAMIHPRNRRPATVVVTALATVGARNMAAVFARCGRSIVTTGT